MRDFVKAATGQQVRAGVLDGGSTDEAVVQWEPPAAAAANGAGAALRLDLGASAPLLARTVTAPVPFFPFHRTTKS